MPWLPPPCHPGQTRGLSNHCRIGLHATRASQSMVKRGRKSHRCWCYHDAVCSTSAQSSTQLLCMRIPTYQSHDMLASSYQAHHMSMIRGIVHHRGLWAAGPSDPSCCCCPPTNLSPAWRQNLPSMTFIYGLKIKTPMFPGLMFRERPQLILARATAPHSLCEEHERIALDFGGAVAHLSAPCT